MKQPRTWISRAVSTGLIPDLRNQPKELCRSAAVCVWGPLVVVRAVRDADDGSC